MSVPLKITRIFLASSFCLAAAALSPAFAASTPTSVSLTATPNPSSYGQIVTLTAQVSSASATGSVTFYDGATVLGTKPLAGGIATLFTILLPSGTRSLLAYYGGDANYAASRSSVLAQMVTAVPGYGFQAVPNSAIGYAAVGDFNGDGKADIATTYAVMLGNGDGTFQPALNYGVSRLVFYSVAVGDFNGDGKADIAGTTSTTNGNTVSVLLGNGDGTFQPPVNYATGVDSSQYVAVADFNGDGKADLAVAGASVRVLLGNGDGTFQAAVNYASVSVQSIAVGDFNGDGKADLVVVGAGGASVLLGNGDGTFQPPVNSQFPLSSTSLWGYITAGSVVVKDFNGDGKTDLAVNNSVFLGNGDGTFRAGVNYGNFTGAQAVAAGDFNGDGKVDLAVGSLGGSVSDFHVFVLLGNGDGTFQAAVDYPYTNANSNGTNAVAVGDFNGDGRADLAINYSVFLGTPPNPDLAISKTHTGSFNQGQSGGTYTITVSNIGSAPTSGTVAVTDMMPMGLTATSMGGTGWTCIIAALSCTREDSLAPSAVWPGISVAVSVAAGTPSTVVNVATVAGGGENNTNTSNDTASDLTHINITEVSQTIAFAPLSNQTLGTSPYALVATASSGLAVSLISNTNTICTVSGSTLTLVAIGTCSITATQGGNASYGAATPVTQTFAVQYAQTITFGALSNVLLVSPPFPISATASSGLPVAFASTTAAVCTISGSTVTSVAAGTCSITATQAGNASYAAAASVTQSFTVIGPAIKQGGINPLYSSSTTIQPGSWISIYGNNLANTAATWNGDFPTSLGGVTVTINGKPAYLWYVSPTQINLQAPDDNTIGPVSVVVKNSSGSTTSTVTLARISPSFSLLGDGVHVAGVIPTPNGTGAYGGGTYDLVGPTGAFPFSTRPVKPGETLILFGVGFGPTNPFVPAGQVFSSAAPTINPVMISIGGISANVAFGGITEEGLYQFNLTVPNAGSGDQPVQAVVVDSQTQAGPIVTVQ